MVGNVSWGLVSVCGRCGTCGRLQRVGKVTLRKCLFFLSYPYWLIASRVVTDGVISLSLPEQMLSFVIGEKFISSNVDI